MPKSKSAYSVAGKKEKLDTHIIVVWVDNEAGVLAIVVGLFSGRGYNIESLAVAEIDQKLNISRITIVTTGTPQVVDQIKLQLKKLVPVHKVADFKREDKNVIFKEMALFKFFDILSISLLKAVICITFDLFVLSNITGLKFLQASKALFSLPLFATNLNNAISLKITFLSSLLKSASLWTGTNFFN